MISEIQQVKINDSRNIELYIKREDLIHPFISGNKYRKLKYNLTEAKQQKKEVLLTFGGAFSNHIAATAYAGKENDFKTIGVIRGEELFNKIETNPTLKFAQENGMQFYFVTREDYRKKETSIFQNELKKQFGDFYLIPEGGTNLLAVKGCEEILNEDDSQFDIICSCVGTGGTISGLINGSKNHQKILGFPALKGDFLKDEICKFVSAKNWELITDYHFGGYGKINTELIAFINDFKSDYNIQLDPIYTGKMLFGIFDLIKNKTFKSGTKILAIHSGGIQGIAGMNQYLKSKGKQLINV